jgi:hypothetical protein
VAAIRIALALVLLLAVSLQGTVAAAMQVGSVHRPGPHARAEHVQAEVPGHAAGPVHARGHAAGSPAHQPRLPAKGSQGNAGTLGCTMTCCQPCASAGMPLGIAHVPPPPGLVVYVPPSFNSWAEPVPRKPPRL